MSNKKIFYKALGDWGIIIITPGDGERSYVEGSLGDKYKMFVIGGQSRGPPRTAKRVYRYLTYVEKYDDEGNVVKSWSNKIELFLWHMDEEVVDVAIGPVVTADGNVIGPSVIFLIRDGDGRHYIKIAGIPTAEEGHKKDIVWTVKIYLEGYPGDTDNQTQENDDTH